MKAFSGGQRDHQCTQPDRAGINCDQHSNTADCRFRHSLESTKRKRWALTYHLPIATMSSSKGVCPVISKSRSGRLTSRATMVSPENQPHQSLLQPIHVPNWQTKSTRYIPSWQRVPHATVSSSDRGTGRGGRWSS
jgi:hypothetical protein